MVDILCFQENESNYLINDVIFYLSVFILIIFSISKFFSLFGRNKKEMIDEEEPLYSTPDVLMQSPNSELPSISSKTSKRITRIKTIFAYILLIAMIILTFISGIRL